MSRVINAGHFQAAKVELSAHPMDRLELFWFARYVRPCMYPDASLQKGWASVNGKSSRLGQDKASRPVQARPACKFGLCPGTTGRSVGGVGPLVLRVLPNLAWKEMEVTNLSTGQPQMNVTGSAKKRLDEITPTGFRPVIHVTLTDDHPWAQAFIVIEALPK